MSTKYRVTIDGQESIVFVKKDNFQASAIVLVECLKHFKHMSHVDAIKLYTESRKSVRTGLLSMNNVSVERCDDSITQCDVEFDVELNDVLTYWTY